MGQNKSLLREVKTLEKTLTQYRRFKNKEDARAIKLDLTNNLFTFYRVHKELFKAFRSYRDWLKEEISKYKT